MQWYCISAFLVEPPGCLWYYEYLFTRSHLSVLTALTGPHWMFSLCPIIETLLLWHLTYGWLLTFSLDFLFSTWFSLVFLVLPFIWIWLSSICQPPIPFWLTCPKLYPTYPYYYLLFFLTFYAILFSSISLLSVRLGSYIFTSRKLFLKLQVAVTFFHAPQHHRYDFLTVIPMSQGNYMVLCPLPSPLHMHLNDTFAELGIQQTFNVFFLRK